MAFFDAYHLVKGNRSFSSPVKNDTVIFTPYVIDTNDEGNY